MRRQLPVHSHLPLRAVLAGLAGTFDKHDARSLHELIRLDLLARDVLLTDSGTSALSLALSAAVPDRAAPVALPAYGCYDLATAADGANTRVVLYDVDPTTLGPEPASFARALARGPRAVVLVHLYGLPVDVLPWQAAADYAGALVINDAAQAVGAVLRGRPVAAFGSLAVLSFGRGKGISGGGGGALLANDDTGVAMLESVRSRLPRARAGWGELGRAVAQYAGARPQVYGLIAALPFLRLGETIYHAPHAPRALSRASSRIVAALWRAANADASIRRTHAARLTMAAQDAGDWRTMATVPRALPGYLRLPLISSDQTRAAHIAAGAIDLGIMPAYPMPLVRLPGFRQRCLNADDAFPGAELLAERLLTLPTHRLLSTDDLLRLERWLQNSHTATAAAASPGHAQMSLRSL